MGEDGRGSMADGICIELEEMASVALQPRDELPAVEDFAAIAALGFHMGLL